MIYMSNILHNSPSPLSAILMTYKGEEPQIPRIVKLLNFGAEALGQDVNKCVHSSRVNLIYISGIATRELKVREYAPHHLCIVFAPNSAQWDYLCSRCRGGNFVAKVKRFRWYYEKILYFNTILEIIYSGTTVFATKVHILKVLNLLKVTHWYYFNFFIVSFSYFT